MTDLRQSPGWEKYLSAIKWTTERIEGRLVLIRKVPLFPFSLIKIQRPKNPLNFKELDNIAKQYKALCIILEPHYQNYDPALFKKNGYRKSNIILAHTATIRLNLKQNSDQLLKSFSENARRNIKKAQNNNLKVEIVSLKDEKDDKKFRQFYSLLQNLTKMKHFYVPGYNETYSRMIAFKNTSQLFFAFEKGTQSPIAAVWTAHFDKTLYYFQTGITEKGYQLLANYLLVWEALKFGQKNKLDYFDFEGIYDPRFPSERPRWYNFSQFKHRFHGEIVEFPHPWIKIYNLPFNIFYLCTTIFSK